MAADENIASRMVTSLYIMCAVSLVFMLLRFFCKWRYGKKGAPDDYVLAVSWVMIAVYSGVIIHGTSYGIGRHFDELSHDDRVNAHKMLAIADFFAIYSLAVSKSSFAITLLRLATETWHKALLWFIIVTLHVFLGFSSISILISCTPIERVFDPLKAGTCLDPVMLLNFNTFAGAWSAAADYVLAIFPWVLIWGLNMRKVEKIGVCFAMSLGFLSGITGSIKTSYIQQSSNWLDWTYILIWTAAETAVVIMAASVPFLRLFLKEIYTSRGSGDSEGASGGRSYRLNTYKTYKSNDSGAGGSRVGRKSISGTSMAGRGGTVTTTVEGGRHHRHHHHNQQGHHGTNRRGDDQSDRSILGEAEGVNGGNGGSGLTITRTHDFSVYYQEGDDVENQKYTAP